MTKWKEVKSGKVGRKAKRANLISYFRSAKPCNQLSSSLFLQDLASETDAVPYTLIPRFSEVCQKITCHLQSRK